MNSAPGYISTSFWDGNTILTLLLLLLMFVTMCLPAMVAFRKDDKRQGGISVALGATGMFLLIPWIVSIVQVTKKYEMPDKKDAALKTYILQIYSAILLGVEVVAINELSTWIDITTEIGVCAYAVALFVTSFFNGRLYWGIQMAIAPLLVTCLNMETYIYWFSPGGILFMRVLIISGIVLIFYNVIMSASGKSAEHSFKAERGNKAPFAASRVRSTVQGQTPPAPVQAPSEGVLRCFYGRYKGAELILKDNETICFGSDPALAHMIFESEQMAPLHFELTYQKENGLFRMVHQAENPVYVTGKATPEICLLRSGMVITFGSPEQAFLVKWRGDEI